ncbi:polysaccharide biosynthesis tyrosine autokinase [candidate division TA06 bacterium]|uniref:non-specific protein-tyrosine kinase n=1 Tax=candidate division TA06 bacterium TaxID=2250710 RepID=A0A933I886_UNCT6|nr:polysaccharide biosynthesis tyrosine autokinase [candidate division TA06 bacterium]
MNQDVKTRTSESNIYELIDLLWRRRLLITACLLGVMLPIVLANFTMPPVYEAQTTVIFEQSREPLPAFDISEAFSRKSYIVNQIEEIKSRALAEEVVRLLDPEYSQILLRGRDRNLSPERQSYKLTQIIKNSISAEPIRDSDVILIKVQGPTPEAVAHIANLVAEVIKERSAAVKREQASSTRKFIEAQLPSVEATLNKAEEAIKSFKSQNQVVSLSDEAKEILSRATEADKQLIVASTERQSIEGRLTAIYDQLKAQGSLTENSLALSAGSMADSLRSSLVNLQMEIIKLQVKGYAPDHPQIKNLNAQIANVKSRLLEELQKITQKSVLSPMPQIQSLLDQIPPLQIQMATLTARELALKTILSQYDFGLSKLPNKELQLARLLRAKEVGESVYRLLLGKHEEAKITEAGKIGNVRVIDQAQPPQFPIKPRKVLNFAIGLVVGITLGVGLSFFLDSLDNSVKTAEDIEHTFELPVLGLIPAIHSEDGKTFRKNGNDEVARISATLVTKYTPRSHVSEAYRSLRTNIQFSRIDDPLKTVVISSAGPFEGKSTSAANLAITTALSGIRTLLVDADLRRPVIHSLFGLEREPGLSNLLAERLPLEKVVRPSGIENLSILTCGAVPPNPSELLGSQRMRDTLKLLSQQYDLALFDSPPVITVTDTAVLSSQVDGIVLVVKSHVTDKRALTRAKTILTNLKANILGVVLNKIELSGLAGSYNYYYHYNYYYVDDGTKKKRGRPTKWWNILKN